MDEFVAISPTRWGLNTVLAGLNQCLDRLKLGAKLGKTSLGRVDHPFDFLGYRFSPVALTVEHHSLQRRDWRLSRLYQPTAQGGCRECPAVADTDRQVTRPQAAGGRRIMPNTAELRVVSHVDIQGRAG